MHTPGAQVSEFVHLAAKICMLGAGCTLNFEHWLLLSTKTNLNWCVCGQTVNDKVI